MAAARWGTPIALASASDPTTGLLVATDGTVTAMAVDARATEAATAALADNPEVIDDAIARAASGAGLVLKTDPGQPVVTTYEEWFEIFVDPSGRMARGIDEQGRTFLRLSPMAQKADGTDLSSAIPGSGVGPHLRAVTSDEFTQMVIDAAGRMAFGIDYAGQTFARLRADAQLADGTLLTARLLPSTALVTKTIKADGTGDYATLFAAFAAATADPGNRFEYIIHPGVYAETAVVGSAGSLQPPVNVVGLRVKDKHNTRISRSLPDASSNVDMALADTILVRYTITIDGLVSDGLNDRYDMHSDAGGINPDTTIAFVNCDFIHYGNTSPNGGGLAKQALGIGTASGQTITFDLCLVVSDDVIHFMHNRENFSKPSRVSSRRSRFVATSATAYPKIPIQSLGSGQPDTFVMEDCELPANTIVVTSDAPWISTLPERQVADHWEIGVHLIRSGPAGHAAGLRGKALKVQSATTGATSTVRFSGTAAAALVGTAKLRDGSAGLAGYAYGYWDISGILGGINQNVATGNTLGARLGDCSTVNKTLTVTIDGTPHDVVFTANHTSDTNAAILGLINAVLGATGTAAEYLVEEEHYPEVVGCQKHLRNATGTGIPKWSAVAYSGVGVKLMGTGDPVSSFAGIAVERIPAGKTGRVITEGYFSATQLPGAPALAAGTPVYHDDTTAGAFALAGTRLAGTPLYAGWLPIKGAR